MTQYELIKKWQKEADRLDAEALDISSYLSEEQRERASAQAEILRSCAADLSAMTY